MNRFFFERLRFCFVMLLYFFLERGLAQPVVSTSVFSTAGGSAQLSRFSLTGTTGQPTEAGLTMGAQFSIYGGFMATGNFSPLVAKVIPEQTLTLNGSSFTRDLNASPAIFVDPDSDILTYAASSSAENIAAASVAGSMLAVAPVALGETTITVFADDSLGGMNATTFKVTVTTLVNRPPVVIVANAIANQTLTIGGAPFVRDLNAPALFSDAENDALTFTAISNSNAIASATISEINLSMLKVVAVTPGVAIITVTAGDDKGNSADTSFSVSVLENQPPVIAHTAVASQVSGQPISVQAIIADDIGVAGVILKYRRAGDASFTAVAMTAAGSLFEGDIPALSVTSRGVEYFIEATDQFNLLTRLPQHAVFSILVQINSAAKPTPQPGGDDANAYRLVSVPFQLSTASAAAVLENDLGQYHNTVWRLIGLDANKPFSDKAPYVEVSQSGLFEPGQSFFLIVKSPNRTINAGPGRSIPTGNAFRLALAPGHNFVATPFNFTIPAGKLSLKSGSTITLRTYDGVWRPQNELAPWEGYYLANNSTSPDTLFINPDLSPGIGGGRAGEIAGAGWRMRIEARCGPARDAENFAGIAAASHDAWDENDLPEPPPIGEFVSVYFPHAEWRKPLARYSDDMRSAAQPNQRWNFVVESNLNHEMVQLHFDGIARIDPTLAVYLADEEMNYKQNLRELASYEYQSRGLDRPKRLSLIAGKEEYVLEETANTGGVPHDFVLEQNFPNPFNPETAIRFGLPEKSVVSLKIYDLSGREIATVLENVELPAGRHQRVWNSRDQRGRGASSGIYFYRLQAVGAAGARKFHQTLKMILAR